LVLLRCLTSKLQHQSNTLDNLQDPLKPSLAVTISKTGIMSTSTQTCKFFDLPPELRNHIYELVLLDTDVEYVVDNWDWEFPSLLHVCTQIRSEALGLYYSRTMFYLTCDDWQDGMLFCNTMIVKWLRALSTTALNALKKVIMEHRDYSIENLALDTEGEGYLIDFSDEGDSESEEDPETEEEQGFSDVREALEGAAGIDLRALILYA
jgi:hypothetical protein